MWVVRACRGHCSLPTPLFPSSYPFLPQFLPLSFPVPIPSLPQFLPLSSTGAFVVLNLIVAVILENFTSLGNLNPDLVSCTLHTTAPTDYHCYPCATPTTPTTLIPLTTLLPPTTLLFATLPTCSPLVAPQLTTTHCSLLTTHHSLRTAPSHHSPRTAATHHSPLTTHCTYSSLTTHCSYSPLTTHYALHLLITHHAL